MEHYVGLDVSLKLTAICIVDRTGKIEREGVVHSDPEAIAAFIKLNAPQALGLPVICIDARHAKAVLKMQINKSDRNDAVGIARIDAILALMEDRPEGKIAFEVFESLLDFDECQIEFPQFGRVAGAEIGAQQIAPFTATHLGDSLRLSA